MKFKEATASDIEAVFFNADEHADTHTVNGTEMLCIVEDDVLADRSAHWEGGAKQSFDSGVYKAATTLRVKAADFGPRPSVGAAIKVDSRSYKVAAVADEAGVWSITMERNRQ